MTTLTITAKGQVTLRKDVLKHLRVQPGQRVEVEKLPDGRIEVRAERDAGEISEVFNLLKRRGGRQLSLAQIDRLARDNWSRRK